jgi:glycosyltransferase involved in cell wall biosynthesis
MKILTNIRFAQTAGIAQTLISFLDFVKKNKKGVLEVVGVNIIDGAKASYSKSQNGNILIISATTHVPHIKDVVERAGSIKDIQKSYRQVVEIYRKAIQSEKPDVVLINGTYYMPWCLYLAAKEEKIPVVLHYHGVLSIETQNWPARQRALFVEMEKSMDREDTFYIFPSKITKKMVEKIIYGHKVKNSAVIPNPVPLHFFENNSENNSKVNIGIVSRWAGIKNVAFCEAFAKYNRNNGSRFIINLISDLKKQDVRYKELSKIIKIHPSVENKKLAGFYKKMGVVISPSHFETYGNVSKEALASGVPAIVNSNMGVAETYKKLGLGKWVISFGSVKRVYKKIENVIGSGVERNVRRKIRKDYSPCKIFNKIVDTLEFVHQTNR